MRKYIEIVEQTMRTGNMNNSGMRKLYDEAVEIFDQFSLVANFDKEWDIYRLDRGTSSYFLIAKENTPLAYYGITIDGKFANLIQAYVDPKARGNKLTQKFCWFIKTRLGNSIVMGEYQSHDAIALIQSLYATEKFKMTWFNGKERIPYDPAMEGPEGKNITDDLGFEEPETFYSIIKPTGWKLILEGGGNYFRDNPLPMFLKEGPLPDHFHNYYNLFFW